MPSRDRTRRIHPAGTLNTCLVGSCCVPGWGAEAGPPRMLLAHLSRCRVPMWVVILLHTGLAFLPTPQSQNGAPLRIQGSTVGGGSCVGGQQEGYSWSRRRGLRNLSTTFWRPWSVLIWCHLCLQGYLSSHTHYKLNEVSCRRV